jgi:hypothetical protein
VNSGDVAPNSPPSTVLFAHNVHIVAANNYRADRKLIRLVLQLIDTVGVDFREMF